MAVNAELLEVLKRDWQLAIITTAVVCEFNADSRNDAVGGET
jgi:hypothetical protein